MYISKTPKKLCILLLTFLLLLGMCFDRVQADSFFSCIASETAANASAQRQPALESSYAVSFLNSLYSEVILGRPASAVIQEQTLRRSFCIRTSREHSFAYLFVYLLPLLFTSILIYKAYSFMPDIRKSFIVIRYIQHKDGKKPHLSF